MGNTISIIFPPKPGFTEKDVPDLSGKVYIITGSNTGVGKELAQILYSKNATVYIAARSEDKAKLAIQSTKDAHPLSKGKLVFLHLDLADLTTIKASAEEFLRKETKLNVLFNNAGVMLPPPGSKTAQGYELQLGTNNLGHFLFTKFLIPILIQTAKTEAPNTVRVIWVSSEGARQYGPKPGGIPMGNLDYHQEQSQLYKYAVSKAGNYLHATEFMRQHNKDGILSVALHPGLLNSDLNRHGSGELNKLFEVLLHPPRFGAYTELFAGLSGEVTSESIGKCDWRIVTAWGRFLPIRKDLVVASKPENEGGTGLAHRWWQWNEDQVQPYV